LEVVMVDVDTHPPMGIGHVEENRTLEDEGEEVHPPKVVEAGALEVPNLSGWPWWALPEIHLTQLWQRPPKPR
jgi:hypothetical protein